MVGPVLLSLLLQAHVASAAVHRRRHASYAYAGSNSFRRTTAFLRLHGGAASNSVTLHDGSLYVVNDMYPSQLGEPVLEGVASDISTATPSPTGGLFLHTTHAAPSHEHVASLGKLRCSRLLAAARVTRYWMGPAFGTRAHHVPHDTQFLLLELAPDGPYAVLLPLTGNGMRASLHGGASPWARAHPGQLRSDELLLHAESGDESARADGMRAIYIAAGADPYALLRRAFAEVADALGSFRPLAQKQLPPSVDVFGWCTWDAFYSRVSPAGVLEGVRALRAGGVPPRFLIIDDGWQQVEPAPIPATEATETTPTGAVVAPTKAVVAPANAVVAPADVVVAPADALAAPSQAVVAAADAVVAAADAAPVTSDVETATVAEGGGAVGAVTLALKRVGAWVQAALMRAVTMAFAAFYEACVRRAPPRALAVRLWRRLARSVLQPSLWQYFDAETDFGRQLASFAPNAKFEVAGDEEGRGSSLAALVATCKAELGVRHLYVWHALAGYWRGASAALGADGALDIVQSVPQPSRHLLDLEPQIAWDTACLFGVGLLTSERQLQRFYSRLHAPLAAAGVDGVKVDVQSAVGAHGGGVGGGPLLARMYTRAMEASVAEHFAADGAAHCINCMCHSTENLYQYHGTSVARASDDFYPRRRDSHTVHIVNVAFNSVFLGEICLPDWDMFTSQHEAGPLHAAARAVGGCPVYVSDVPGQSDVPLLRRLVLPDGSVLRARLPGRPTRDCLFRDVGTDGVSALKVWNANAYGAPERLTPTDTRCAAARSPTRRARTQPARAQLARSPRAARAQRSRLTSSDEGVVCAAEAGGVVGAFNVQGVAWSWRTRENVRVQDQPPSVIAAVRPADVETLRGCPGPFAVWRHRSGRIERLATIDTPTEVTLSHREWEVLTVVPIVVQGAAASGRRRVEWAPFGLGEMLNSGGALLEVGDLVDALGGGGGTEATLTCRAPGLLHAFCQPAPSSVLLEGGATPLPLSFRHDEESGMLAVRLPEHLATVTLTVVWPGQGAIEAPPQATDG